jgi:hypothetical protein
VINRIIVARMTQGAFKRQWGFRPVIHNLVVGIALFFLRDVGLYESVKRLEAEPAQFPLMVVVPLGVGKEGSVVEDADPAYRVA